jgi:hypothetical protein
LAIKLTYGNGKCIAHWFFKFLKILNTEFQHTSKIEMYCIENVSCWEPRTHGFQDPQVTLI